MKVKNINHILNKYIFQSLILIIEIIIYMIVFYMFRFIFFNFQFLLFFILIIMYVCLIDSLIKLFYIVYFKKKYSIISIDYYLNGFVISSNSIYYLDSYKYNKIDINSICRINRRVYCSIDMEPSRFGFKLNHYGPSVIGGGNGLPRHKNAFGDIVYCLKILDNNNKIIYIKIKKESGWLNKNFYNDIFDIIKKYNKDIMIVDDELLKVHWIDTRFRKQSDFEIKDYLIVNDKVYDKWILDSDKDDKNERKKV